MGKLILQFFLTEEVVAISAYPLASASLVCLSLASTALTAGPKPELAPASEQLPVPSICRFWLSRLPVRAMFGLEWKKFR